MKRVVVGFKMLLLAVDRSHFLLKYHLDSDLVEHRIPPDVLVGSVALRRGIASDFSGDQPSATFGFGFS